MKNRTLLCSIFLIIIGMMAGCVMTKEAKQWDSIQPRQKSYVHTIKWPDENLSIISSWYTGSNKNDKKLANNNPNINPKQLIIGDRIFIPKDLLITRDPMTKKFVDQSIAKPQKTELKSGTKKPKKKKPDPKPEPIPEPIPKPIPEEEEELILFGPK